MNFEEANEKLGKRESRKLANNTYLIRHDAKTIFVRLHATDIIFFHSDGTVTLDTGGWQTVTTKDRFNHFGPDGINIWSDRGEWKVSTNPYWQGRTNPEMVNPPRAVVPFVNRMRFDPKDLIGSTANLRDMAEEAKRIAGETTKAINAYCRKLTDDKLASMVADARENGMSGDCWLCMFDSADIRDNGRQAKRLSCPVDFSTDDDGMPNDHLLAHLAEEYFHVTLLVAALHWAGYRDSQMGSVVGMGSLVRRALKRYLKARLVVPAQIDGSAPVTAMAGVMPDHPTYPAGFRS